MARRDVTIAQKVRDRIAKWDNNWRFNKDQYHMFTSFVMGSQWTEDESQLFIDYKKIPLSFNKLAPLINHLVGDQRQNTPNLQVMPDESVDVETARTREALIKNISLDSKAKQIYQNAFQQAAIGGFSCIIIETDYERPDSFNLEIMLRGLKDPTTAYWDISAESICKTDGMFAGYRTRMSRKRFASLYGKSIERQIGADANYDEASATGWIFSNDDEITVIDDFERKYDKTHLYLLSNDREVETKEFNKLERVEVEGQKLIIDNGELVTVVNDKIMYKYKIIHRKIAGEFLLEENDFPSEQLPVVFVDQNSYYEKSGKQICRPFVKDARDAQRYINYLGTQSAYILRVTRFDQFLVSKSNVRSPDTQTIWKDPATAQGGLIFDEADSGFVPQQLRPAELPNSLISQYQRSLADIESSTGMYGTQMGEQGNETSGKAIDARTRRGSYNTYVPFDSLNRSIACIGEIINEMIPRVYDSERNIMLNFKDTGDENVILNQQIDDYGSQIKNDMSKGNYKIRLLPGPSLEGQKQENLESIQQVLQVDPTSFGLVADLYVENLPMANNIEMRNRLRTRVPPEIIEAGRTGKPVQQAPQPPPPEVMLKMQQLQMQQQQFQSEMQLKMMEFQLKEKEFQLKSIQTGQDMSSDIQALENERLKAAAQLREQELRYQAEMQRLSGDMQISHADNLVKLLTHKSNKDVNYDSSGR